MKSPVPVRFNRFTRAAVCAALAGGKVLASHYERAIAVEFKGLIDPVTVADRNSQEAVFGILRKDFPAHTLLGEEQDRKAVCGEHCWIVDPLDGTVNFIHGLPIFCVSVALAHRGEIVSGVIHAPLLGETYIAEKGKGAWRNGRRISVSGTSRLVRSLVVTGFPYYVHERPREVIRDLANVLVKVQGLRRLGSAALDLAYVAGGRLDAFWEEGLSAWDVAAGSLLVTEAGGTVTDFRGGSRFLFGKSILATNGKLHRPMRGLLGRGLPGRGKKAIRRQNESADR